MQKNTPKVSVIIPLYNSYQYLEESLNCVVNQTLQDIEIIIVNDGSTDGSEKLAQKFADKDRRIQLIHQENQGAAIARNKGLSLAKGEYLSFLDSDDVFELNMLEEMYNQAKKFDAEIVVCPFRYLGDDATIRRGLTLPTVIDNFDCFSAKDISSQILQISSPTAWSKLFKKDFILKHRIQFQNLTTCNDIFFTYFALLNAKKITILNTPFVTYRNRAQKSISSNRGSGYENILKALNLIKLRLKEEGLFDLYELSFFKRSLSNINYESLYIENKNDIKIFLEQSLQFLNNLKD